MSALATPVASVAGGEGGAISSSGASPTSELEIPVGAPDGGEAGTSEPGAAAQPEPGAEGDAGKSDGPGTDGDGRVIPAKWRETFQKDRDLRALFFADKAWKSEFPKGLPEARELKQSFDLIGGKEGLNQLQTDVADFRDVASQFVNGDPKFVDDLAAEDPIAFSTQVPHIINKFQEVDPEGFSREIARRVHAEHESSGLRPAIEQIYSLIKSGKNDEALKLLNGVASWHDNVANLAKAEDDPRVKKLQDQIKQSRQNDQKTTQEATNRAYQEESKSKIGSMANKLLDSFTKGKAYDDDERSDLMSLVLRKANSAIEADTDWKAQRDLLARRGDKDASVRFAVARWERALNEIVPKVIRLASKGAAPQARQTTGRPAAAAPAAPAGFQAVKQRPTPPEIDVSQTTAAMIAQKQAVLKGGRKVSWAGVE